VRLVVDVNTLQILERIDYDEFGRVILDTNPGAQHYGFAGGAYNFETLMMGNEYRMYDPLIGRWTSKDPIGFNGGDTNLYGYVLNDPVNFIDPSGLAPADSSSCEYYQQLCKTKGGSYCQVASVICKEPPPPPKESPTPEKCPAIPDNNGPGSGRGGPPPLPIPKPHVPIANSSSPNSPGSLY
jgi:RHS repeat-associated protein